MVLSARTLSERAKLTPRGPAVRPEPRFLRRGRPRSARINQRVRPHYAVNARPACRNWPLQSWTTKHPLGGQLQTRSARPRFSLLHGGGGGEIWGVRVLHSTPLP